MAEDRISIELVGAPEDNGQVRLSAFIAQLEAVKTALRQTERLVTGEEEPSVYYRIADLRHGSPATVVLEAVSEPLAVERPRQRKRREVRTDYSRAVVQEFFFTLGQIRLRQPPPKADLQALESYRNLTVTLEKKVSAVRIINAHASVSIDTDFRAAIDEIIGPDELVEGSVCGMLERVNIHNITRFDVFPEVGPMQVACDFRPDLKQTVVKALDQHVCVFGKLRYKRLSTFPYAINVEGIEIFPPDQELPTIFDVKGMAPDLTGGRGADGFLEAIRDAEG